MGDGSTRGSGRRFRRRVRRLVCGIAAVMTLLAVVTGVASAAVNVTNVTLQNATGCPAGAPGFAACGPPGSVLVGGVNSNVLSVPAATRITPSTVQVTRTGTPPTSLASIRWTITNPTTEATVGQACVVASNANLNPTVNPTLPRAPGSYTISFQAFPQSSCGGTGGAVLERTVLVTRPEPNPHHVLPCGLTVALVLDESASLSAQEGQQTQDAASQFVHALAGSGARVAVIAFAQRARTLVDYTEVTGQTIDSTFTPAIDNQFLSPGGTLRNGTNWHSAFSAVNSLGSSPSLVMFITDGDPNATGSTTSFTTALDGGVDVMRPAVADADLLKREGSHVFALGVGAAVHNHVSESRLTAVSGPRRFTEQLGITNSDWATLDFNELAASLRHFVGELCEGTLTVTKHVWLPNATGWAPANGWKFTATLTPPPAHEWHHPASAGTRDSASLRTGTDGVARFEWQLHEPLTANLSVRETAKKGFEFVRSQCIPHQADGTQGNPVQGTSEAIADKMEVPPRGWVTCEVQNRQKVAHLEVIKHLVPANDPGRFDLLIDGVAHKTDATDGSTTGRLEVGLGRATVGERATTGTHTKLSDYAISITCRKGRRVVAHARGPSVSVRVRRQTDDIVCTITNTNTTHGSLTVIKHVLPHDDPGRFELVITRDGHPVARKDNVTDGGTLGPRRLRFGTYEVSEAEAAGTVLARYHATVRCIDETTGDVVVAVNGGSAEVMLTRDHANVQCTITNVRGALPGVSFLRLHLRVIPSDDPGRFDLHIDGDTFAHAVGNGGTTARLQFEPHSDHEVGLTATASPPGLVSLRRRGVVSLDDYSIRTACLSPTHHVVAAGTGPSPVLTRLTGEADNVRCEIVLTRTHPPGPEPGGGGGVPPDPCHEFGSDGRPECGDVAAAPHLMVSKQMPAHARVGDRVPIAITVKNVGHATAHGVSVTETPPGGGRIVHVDDHGSLRHDGTVEWNLGSLGAGEQRTVHATMLVTRAGLLTDTAVAAAANDDPAFDVAPERTAPAARRPPPGHHPKRHPPRFTG